MNGKVAAPSASTPSTPVMGMKRSESTLARMAAKLLPAMQREVVVLLGAWRALTVGTLHAYHSVRVELVVSGGNMSVQQAGALIASTDAMAMALLVPLSLLPRWIGLRPLLILMPLLALAAAVVLIVEVTSSGAGGVGLGRMMASSDFTRNADAWGGAQQAHAQLAAVQLAHAQLVHAQSASFSADHLHGFIDLHKGLPADDTSGGGAGADAYAWGGNSTEAGGAFETTVISPIIIRAALLVIAIAEIASPIVPLALVPAAAGDVLGAAYGTIEVMFALTQMCIALLLGVVRSSWGFTGALVLICSGFAAAIAVSLPLMARTKAGDPQEDGQAGTPEGLRSPSRKVGCGSPLRTTEVKALPEDLAAA